jgi:hypothetical protein
VWLGRWLQSALGLLAISLLVFAVPTQFEGPVLWHVSPGHAIAVADGVAIVPLVAANWLLYWGLWRERAALGALVRRHPGRGGATIFTGGAPGVGASRCTGEHVGLALSGTAAAAFEDGRVVELKAGELFYIPPVPHDSWVVGNEPYVSLHFLGAEVYATAKTETDSGR